MSHFMRVRWTQILSARIRHWKTMSVRHCNRYNNIARPWKLVPPHFSLRVSVELSGIMETGKHCLSNASTPALLSTIIFRKCLCFSYFILDRTTSLHAGHCRPALPLLYCNPTALYLYERLEDFLVAHRFLKLHSISMGIIYCIILWFTEAWSWTW